MSSRIDEARSVVRTLLDALEEGETRADRLLMKAARLARLMRDTDAQQWLEFEASGYPNDFQFASVGTCSKYAAAAGRLNVKESKFLTQSLPELEAIAEAQQANLSAQAKPADAALLAKDFIEMRATEALLASHGTMQLELRKAYANTRSIVAALRSAIHSYATDTYLAIELGDAAETIFEAARNRIDGFVRAHCPKAAEKLVAINERMADGSTESRTAALTSCRRLLLDIADAVFPASSGQRIDASGKARDVGPEQYKNRLLAFLEVSRGRDSSFDVVESQISDLAARLDAIHDKTCKGVHVDVSEDEARLAVIHTYLFVGEVAARAGGTRS